MTTSEEEIALRQQCDELDAKDATLFSPMTTAMRMADKARDSMGGRKRRRKTNKKSKARKSKTHKRKTNKKARKSRTHRRR